MVNSLVSLSVALGGVVLSALFFRFRLRQGRSERPWLTVILTYLAALICGVVLSKLTYALCQFRRTFMISGFGALFDGRIESFSFVGFAAGTMLGARVFLNLVEHTSLGSVPTVNLFAPCWALMLAVVRFSERWQGVYGVGDLIENTSLQVFPIAQKIAGEGYTEWYLAVYVFECAWALLCALVCLIAQKVKKETYKTGFSAERVAFYLCLMQILFQSLNASDMNKWLFVRVEQLLSGLLVLFFIIRYAWMTRTFLKQKVSFQSMLPTLVTIFAILLVVLAEFMLDKPYYFFDIPAFGAYIVMGVALLIMAAMEIVSARRRFAAQKQRHLYV